MLLFLLHQRKAPNSHGYQSVLMCRHMREYFKNSFFESLCPVEVRLHHSKHTYFLPYLFCCYTIQKQVPFIFMIIWTECTLLCAMYSFSCESCTRGQYTSEGPSQEYFHLVWYCKVPNHVPIPLNPIFCFVSLSLECSKEVSCLVG